MSKYPKEYYNRYKNFDYSRLNDYIVANLRRSSGGPSPKLKVTVDLGCGIGRLIYNLKDYSERSIGIDISPDALEIAIRDKTGVFFVLGDGLKLPLKDSICDMCTCIHVLEHIREADLLLEELHRIMTINGRVIFITPNKRWSRFALPFLKDETHVREFVIDELKPLISRYFYIEEVKSFSMFTHFGIFNPVLNTLVRPDIYMWCIKK